MMNITGIEWLITAVRTIGWRSWIWRILEFVVRNAIGGRYVIVMMMMMIESAKVTHFTSIRLSNCLNGCIGRHLIRWTLHETIFNRWFRCGRRNYVVNNGIRLHVWQLRFTIQGSIQFIVSRYSGYCLSNENWFKLLKWHKQWVETYLFRSNRLQNGSNDFDLPCSESVAVDGPDVIDVPEKLAYSRGAQIACEYGMRPERKSCINGKRDCSLQANKHTSTIRIMSP